MPAKTPGATDDPYTTSTQWSRRFIGLKFFLSLAHHGETGYVAMIERQTRMGELLREELNRAGWRVVNSTPLPLVCFTRDGLDTQRFLKVLYDRQIAWMSEVRLGDSAPVLRACITSFHTSETGHRRDRPRYERYRHLEIKRSPVRPAAPPRQVFCPAPPSQTPPLPTNWSERPVHAGGVR